MCICRFVLVIDSSILVKLFICQKSNRNPTVKDLNLVRESSETYLGLYYETTLLHYSTSPFIIRVASFLHQHSLQPITSSSIVLSFQLRTMIGSWTINSLQSEHEVGAILLNFKAR